MSNEFVKIVKDIGKGIEYPFEHAAQLIAAVKKGLADEPAVRAAIVGLIQKGESLLTGGTAIGASVTAAAAADGTNLAADAAAVTAVETEAKNADTFWQYFKGTFVPEVETIWKDVEQIVDGGTTTTTTTTTTTAPSA